MIARLKPTKATVIRATRTNNKNEKSNNNKSNLSKSKKHFKKLNTYQTFLRLLTQFLSLILQFHHSVQCVTQPMAHQACYCVCIQNIFCMALLCASNLSNYELDGLPHTLKSVSVFLC